MTFAVISPSEPGRATPSQPLQRTRGEGRIAFEEASGRTRLAELYQRGAAKVRLPRGTTPGAEAVLVTSRANPGTAPVLTVEVVNQLTLDTFTTTSCAIPYDPKGTSGEVLGSCGGCHFFVEEIP